MRLHRGSRVQYDSSNGRRGGQIVQGRSTGQPSEVALRKAATADVEVPEGSVRCPDCGRIVKLRPSDGEMRAHKSSGVIPCLAARPTFGVDRHGNTRYTA